MNNSPTIWVVNEAGHNYSGALDLVPNSTLQFLSIGNINPLFFDRMTDMFAEGIAKYVKEGDYLLIAGTPPANAVVYHLWMLMFKEVNALLWDAKRGMYKIARLTEDHAKDLLQSHL